MIKLTLRLGEECSEKEAELHARIAGAAAQAVKGWDALEDRKRILRGRPLPGSFRPQPPKAKGKKTGPNLAEPE
ncbi:MAG: hypothetical protein L0Y58_01465 [Verrucomicrobia subdivision 3 bacterium]|nr:hypothetical protein [Limisphaerales bacterium]